MAKQISYVRRQILAGEAPRPRDCAGIGWVRKNLFATPGMTAS
jgi:hypothetical protein